MTPLNFISRRHFGRTALAAVLALAGGLLPAHVAAQDYPAKPITLVVGYPPGGSTDLTGRVVATVMNSSVLPSIG